MKCNAGQGIIFADSFKTYLNLCTKPWPADCEGFFFSFLMDKRTFRWIAAGLYYGYPTCCIKSFLQRKAVNWATTPAQDAVNKATGFIPCQEHSSEILAGKTSLAGILQNRVCISPFPLNEDGDLDLFIKNSITKIFKQKINETIDLLF